MSKQDEMIKQLELLRSKYEGDASIDGWLEIYQQRYNEISNTIAEQIDPSSFYQRPNIDGKTIVNQFELIDAKGYQEEIKEGVIYLQRVNRASKQYILTCIKLNNKMSQYFVMYGEMTKNQYITWSSSGYSGWNGYPTLRDCILNWIGTGTTYILKDDPTTRTLNVSRSGFL